MPPATESVTRMRLYADLDHTLINTVVDAQDRILRIEPRPGVDRFLASLARHGELWLLTASERTYALGALDVLGPAARAFSGAIFREDLEPVAAQIRAVLGANVEEGVRQELWGLVQPIAPSGVVFDDFPVDSEMFLLKATAVSAAPEDWIQVEPFATGRPDRGGLAKAYSEFRARFQTGPRIGGRRRIA